MLLPFRYFKESFFSWVMEDSMKNDNSGFQEMVDFLEISMACFKPKYSMVRPTVLDDEQLQRIRVPTLFLVGENERIYSPLKAIDRLNRVAPLIKKDIIPKAGHDLFIVQAEMVKRKLWLKVHLAQQRIVARVGAQFIIKRSKMEINHGAITILDRFFEPF